MIFKQLEVVEDDALHRTLYKKMAPPLVTLLSAEPEIQYVALRNINLIVQKYPTILAHEVKVRCEIDGGSADSAPVRSVSINCAGRYTGVCVLMLGQGGNTPTRPSELVCSH